MLQQIIFVIFVVGSLYRVSQKTHTLFCQSAQDTFNRVQ